MEHIGFIGLGIMGKPMAKNLLGAGYELTVYDVVPTAMEELKEFGANVACCPKMVAAQCSIIITMLPNSPHVREVVMGESGILSGSSTGHIILDMSSIAPAASQEISVACVEKGVIYLDCPVSGGEPKAIDGTLSIMCGGPSDTFESIKPILLKMGASAVLVGDVGSGNVTKLANQIIVAVNIAAVSEALALAVKAGVDPQKVFEAIRGGLAGSTVMNAKVPMMLNRNFKPGFRTDLHIKDLTNAMETGSAVDAPLPLSSQVLEMMHDLRADGNEKLDHSALALYYEKLAKVVIEPKA